MKERDRVDDLRDLVTILFLCLSWDARQRAKRLMSGEDERLRHVLAGLLGGEPTW